MFLKILLLTISSSHGFLFFEAETKEGFDLAKGSVLASTMLDEMANMEENNGISLTDLERTLSRHDSDANQLLGNGRNIESGFEELSSTQYITNSNRKAADKIRKSTRLIKALCALGPESCTAANAHMMLTEQRQTNEILLEQQKIDKLIYIKTENEKVKKTQATVKTLKTIESLPLTFLTKLNEAIN